MPCAHVEPLLDAFVDTELDPSQLLEVARHAATCVSCDGAIRELTALRESVAALVAREAESMDLSGVWPAVAAAIGTPAPRAARGVAPVVSLPRREPGPRRSLSRTVPMWGAMLALAASLFVWINPVTVSRAPEPVHQQVAQQVALVGSTGASARGLRSSNHADIDRLAGKDIAVRREPKNGTTIIWVNHAVEDGR